MPEFCTEVRHDLGAPEATDRLTRFVEQVRSQYQEQVSQVDGQWQDHVLTFSITTYGFTIDGTLAVHDDRAEVRGTLPFAALPFRGKIEQSIASELRRELS